MSGGPGKAGVIVYNDCVGNVRDHNLSTPVKVEHKRIWSQVQLLIFKYQTSNMIPEISRVCRRSSFPS